MTDQVVYVSKKILNIWRLGGKMANDFDAGAKMDFQRGGTTLYQGVGEVDHIPGRENPHLSDVQAWSKVVAQVIYGTHY
jgi:hypothetical protein